MPLLKTCTACGVSKPEDVAHFFTHKECRGGLDTACRVCRQAERRAWRRRNAERLATRRRAVYAEQNGERHKALEAARKERHPFRVTAENLIGGLRDRASKHGHELAPELRTKAYVEAWLRRQPHCECCGVELLYGPKSGQKHDASPSFDRFDLAEGYTLRNTALICWRCNNIKRNYREQDLRLVADWMEQRRLTAWGHEAGKFDPAAPLPMAAE